jgi:ParB-like chromosome segregation protein Spo0J
MEKVEE